MFIKHWRSFTGKPLIQLKVVGYIMPDLYYNIILYYVYYEVLGSCRRKTTWTVTTGSWNSLCLVIYDVSVQTWEDGAESKINNTPSFFLKHRTRIQVFRYPGVSRQQHAAAVSGWSSRTFKDDYFIFRSAVCVARSSTISYWQHNSTCNKNIKSCINCSNISNLPGLQDGCRMLIIHDVVYVC